MYTDIECRLKPQLFTEILRNIMRKKYTLQLLTVKICLSHRYERKENISLHLFKKSYTFY